jgi:hypothetical protein
MIEEHRLAFLRAREEQELETAYRSISTARKLWHLAIAGGYSMRILEIEKNIAAGKGGAG